LKIFIFIQLIFAPVLIKAQLQTITKDSVSEPIVYALGDSIYNGGNISKKHLINLSSLIIKQTYPLSNYRVLRFTIEILHKQNSKGALPNYNYIFSNDTKLFLQNADIGDEIIFNHIVMSCPTSKERTMPPIKLIITRQN